MSLASSLVKRVKAIFRRGDRVADVPEVSVQLRDAVATIGNADAMDLARRLSAKEITLTTFQQELYLMTRHAHIAQFALSRGGMDALTAADREVLGRLVGEQASYLRQFAADIGAGKLTPEQIAQRAALYPESAVKAHSLGMMAALDIDPPNVPPEHPHCFPAGTVVSGPRAVGSTVRWYDGDLVEIGLSSGTLLSVTPNHPILTPQGWVDAGLLDEGCDVVGGLGLESIASVIEPNNYDDPALIEEVAVSLRSTLPVATVVVPVAPEDFHGDGCGSQVCVVRTDGELRNGGNATFRQPGGKQVLSRGDVQPTLLPGKGRTALSVPGVGCPANGIVSSGSESGAFLFAHSTEPDAISFGAGTKSASMFDQDALDNSTRDAEMTGECQDTGAVIKHHQDLVLATGQLPADCLRMSTAGIDALEEAHQLSTGEAGKLLDRLKRLAGHIPVDRVLFVKRRAFHGHVYNLETNDGWYIANGIVAHNCRCRLRTEVDDDGPAVYWDIQPDACPVCVGIAATMNPWRPA